MVPLSILQGGKNHQSKTLPGQSAVVLEISAKELKAPLMKLLDDLPHMTLQSATWDSTPVSVKRFKGQEGNEQLLLSKEANLLR